MRMGYFPAHSILYLSIFKLEKVWLWDNVYMWCVYVYVGERNMYLRIEIIE